MVGSFVANMIQGFASEKLRMGDEGRAALAAQKETEAQEKMEAMKIVATHLNDADFIKSGFYNTPYFLSMIEKSGQDKDTIMKSITGLANKMADVDSSISYGDIVFPKFGGPKEYAKNLSSSNFLTRANARLNTVQAGLRTEEQYNNVLNHFRSNPGAAETFKREMYQSFDDYNIGAENANTNEDGVTRSFISAETSYANINRLLNDLGEPNAAKKSRSNTAKSQAKQRGLISDINFSYLITSENGDGRVVELPEEYNKYIQKLVNYVPRFKNDVDLMLQEFGTLVPGDGEEIPDTYKLHQTLIDSLDLIKEEHDMTINGAMSEQGFSNLGSHLIKHHGSDRFAMAAAVSLVLKPEAQVELSRTDKNKTVTEAALAKEFEIYSGGLKAADVKASYNAGIKLQTQLSIFKAATNETGTTGFARFIQTAGIKVFGEGGQIDQIFSSEAVGKLKDKTTAQSLEDIAREAGFFQKEKGTAAARAESQMIALAMAMARAADPGGRLSNQDFETQLTRLGAAGIIGDTMENVVVKLRDIAEEFNRDLERNKVMNLMLSKGVRLTPQNIRYLKADGIVQVALDEKYLADARAKMQDNTNLSKNEEVNKEKDLLKGFVLAPTLETEDGGDVYFSDGQYRDAQGNDVGNTVREKTTEKVGT